MALTDSGKMSAVPRWVNVEIANSQPARLQKHDEREREVGA
jgi:hypothetical protein